LKILILTQYFPPETGAPQNRLHDLALKLQAKGAVVSVLTGFPNYPRYEVFPAYKGKWYGRENLDELEVHRSWIYVTKRKSIIYRLLNYFSFTFSAFWAGWWRLGKTDVIICESPPLFLGITAVLLKWIKGAQLVFNVSDLWPESAVKLGIIENKALIKVSTILEEWIYRRSDKVSGQTQGIVHNIQSRFPEKPVFWFRNGVDATDLEARMRQQSWRAAQGFGEEDVLFYFGGLIGYAQGLDCMIHAADRLKALPNVKFVVVGDGPDKERLLQLKQQLGVDNIYFFDGVPKSEIINIIQSIDVAIIPLKKIDLFLGAIPSKIFEIIYLKKPLLLGIEGEAKTLFIDEAKAGLAFEPENAEALAQQIQYLLAHRNLIAEFGANGHDYVNTHFNRVAIANEFWQFIQSSDS